MHATLTASQMHQYAPATLLTRYTDALFSQYLEQNSEYFRCSNSACNSGQIVDMAYTSTYISCPDCKTQTCITCDTVWHPNMSHDDNLASIKQAEVDRLAKLNQEEREEQEKRQREKDQEDAAALELMERDSALCAKCGLWMIKISGCDHMTCEFILLSPSSLSHPRSNADTRHTGKCGHQLCYVCRADYKPIARLGNHHHKSDCKHYRAIPTSLNQRTTQPRTTQPRPTQPRPTQPRPTQPRPTQPRPTQPRPTQPRPTQARSTQADVRRMANWFR